ncbi:hypothetical protein VTK56DRAFT_8690 [Thermocarpiscus australiensis]
MRPYRPLTRSLLARISRPTLSNPRTFHRSVSTKPAKMSFFPRSFYNSDPSFTPLFRLLDEFDNYAREVNGHQDGGRRRGRHHVGTFNPRFDVRETDSAYELHGELPGIDRDKVQIEFTDPQTLVISGRVERSYASGTAPTALEGTQASGAITEKGEQHNGSPESAKEASGGEVAHTNGNRAKGKAPFEKYWVQERSVGEFARTFSFPSEVDQDAVSAKLNNGILSLVVPKAQKHQARRITIN